MKNLKQRNISIGGYDIFYIKEPKLRKIEKSKYIEIDIIIKNE